MLRHERAHYAGNHNMNEPRFAIKDTNTGMEVCVSVTFHLQLRRW